MVSCFGGGSSWLHKAGLYSYGQSKGEGNANSDSVRVGVIQVIGGF